MSKSYLENTKRRVPRLKQAIETCRRHLEPFRQWRYQFAKQYVGKSYSHDGAPAPVPINMIKMYCNIVPRHLVAHNPRVMMATKSIPLKPTVHAMMEHTNILIEKIDLACTLRRVILDAFFGLGICKVALTHPAEAEDDYRRSPGQGFASPVDMDDWVHETNTNQILQACFMGHRYQMPLERAKEMSLFNKQSREKLTAQTNPKINETGDERIKSISFGNNGWEEMYEEQVDLWEIYLPREKAVVTISLDGPEEYLRIQDWIGPACGPYHFCYFNDVPGNSMPSPPISDLWELHRNINVLARKLIRQAERQKSVLGVQNSEDGDRIKDANDGDILTISSPQHGQEYSFGHFDPQNLALMMQFKDVLSQLGGNLELLGGLGPQSDTLGQDQMLQQNSSKIIKNMQGATVTFSRSVMTALAWYYWSDPFEVYQVRRSVPGLADVEYISQITPQMRQVPFEDLEVDIDPYSMADDSPSTRLAALNQLVMQVILPAQQMLAQQGAYFNIETYLKKVAQYANMPDLNEIIHFSSPTEAGGVDSGSGGQPQSPMTTHTNVRVNRPGATQGGKNAALIQTLLGGRPQDSEMAALGRPAA